MQTRLSLKKGKERPILQHHHWVYSGAVECLFLQWEKTRRGHACQGALNPWDYAELR